MYLSVDQSAKRGLDAIRDVAQEKAGLEITRFGVGGASKVCASIFYIALHCELQQIALLFRRGVKSGVCVALPILHMALTTYYMINIFLCPCCYGAFLVV